MASRRSYPAELRAQAVRMVADLTANYPSRQQAIEAVARQLGIGSPETVRRWVHDAAVNAERHPSREHQRAKPGDPPLKVRVHIKYVGGLEGAALERAQGQALRRLLEALAEQQPTTPESDDESPPEPK